MSSKSPGSLRDLLSGLDARSSTRGDQFERICLWYLSHDPAYKFELKKIWLWDQWPGRWGPDAGIDLVAETHSGELWAIQAKAYAPKHSITKADVNTFLSESSRAVFSYRLLIATTNRIGQTALRTVREQEKPVGLKLLSDLEGAELVWPSSPSDLRAPRPVRHKPRPHQRKAVGAVCRGFKTSSRGQLIMACGTGKTHIGLWVAERLHCQRTLVLMPSLSLLAQTMREWTAHASKPFDILPVCSDETVRGGDHLVSYASELGLPVTTDPEAIASFLRRRGPRVVFSTYQSSPRIAEAFQLRASRFDLVIADEAHRCAGSASADFATVLARDAIRSHRRLFMTATPRYFTDRIIREAREKDFEIASMDDDEAFGPVFHRLTFGDAIEQDLLSDYQVSIVGVDDPTYRKWAEQGRFVTRDGKEITDARTLAGQIGLAKAMRKYDLRRTISFHNRVKRAKEFSSSFQEVVDWMPGRARPQGRLTSDYVSGKMSSGQRDVRLNRLRHLEANERGLLSNARCLAEGVDVPSLDGVAFIDPRRSQVDIVQAVGRAIRKAKNKKLGTIVLPVFVDQGEDTEEVLNASAFEPVWWVLKALRAHDEQLAEELDEIRRQMGQLGRQAARAPRKIKFDLPLVVGEAFTRAFQARLVETCTASWEFGYGLLQRFVAREGHARVPALHQEGELQLGAWVGTCRQDHKKRKLTDERVTALEAVPGWTWDPIEDDFQQGLEALRSFVDRERHARVPTSHQEGEVQLGKWVSHRRNAHRKRKLTDERVAVLEAVPGWTWDQFEDDFQQGLEALRSFVAREGHGHMPRSYREGEFQLGVWVSSRRTHYKKGGLTEDRVAALLAVSPSFFDPRR